MLSRKNLLPKVLLASRFRIFCPCAPCVTLQDLLPLRSLCHTSESFALALLASRFRIFGNGNTQSVQISGNLLGRYVVPSVLANGKRDLTNTLFGYPQMGNLNRSEVSFFVLLPLTLLESWVLCFLVAFLCVSFWNPASFTFSLLYGPC